VSSAFPLSSKFDVSKSSGNQLPKFPVSGFFGADVKVVKIVNLNCGKKLSCSIFGTKLFDGGWEVAITITA